MLTPDTQQQSLFDADPLFINAGKPAQHSWLWGGAHIMRTAVAAPTFFRVMSESVDEVRAVGAQLNRGTGELVEAEMAPRLDAATQATLAGEIIDALNGPVPGFGTVTNITWAWLGGGRKRADFLVTVHASERTVVLPTNVKVTAPYGPTVSKGRWDVAAAAATLMLVALGKSFDEKTRLNVDGAVLDFCEGKKRIVGGDYFILNGHLDSEGVLKETSAQGLLSTVIEEDGVTNLAIRRHATRPADMLFWRSDLLLPAGFDVNAAFARAMLPRRISRDAAAALAVSAAAPKGATRAQLAALAQTARAQIED